MATADRMERDAKKNRSSSGTARNKKPGAKMVVTKSTGVRAGKSKASTAARKLQNAGVKDGTIRMGAKGKSKNMYDAKTGTWKKVTTTTVSTKATAKSGRPKSGSPKGGSNSKTETGGDFERWFKRNYPGVPYPGDAAAKAKAKKDGKGPRWWQAGGGGLVGSNKK